jgi:hypothetical protein
MHPDFDNSDRVSSSTRPRVLLAATCRWFTTARLAMALADAGCEVEAVCPRGHPVTRTRAVARTHAYRPLAPLASVRAALEAAQPDVVIPCDDLATAHLHRVYEGVAASRPGGVATRTLLEHSLGDPTSFPIIASRAALIAFAQERGVRVPPTAAVRAPDELRHWLRRHGLPAVLKSDGTYGGRGVRVAHTEGEAVAAFHALSAPPSVRRALKRAVVNRDATYVLPCALRQRPAVSVQGFVTGRDANSAALCWHGQVVASITATVVHTLDERGPASVLQLVDNGEIAGTVERIARELKLSGLVGLDFIVEDGTGAAHLIEMNPRATQVCHMSLGPGRDLPAALRAMLCGEPVRDVPAVTGRDLIALFPQEWMRDPASPFLKHGYHDVPWDEPGLVRACLQEDIRSKIWSMLASSMRFFKTRGSRSAHGQTS